MDSVGGQMDAFTTKENTCFYVQVLDEHLPLAVDLLTDILLHPLFDAEELEREKSVVLQEIRMVEDTPGRRHPRPVRGPGVGGPPARAAHPRHPRRWSPASAARRSPTGSPPSTCRRGSSSRWPATSPTSRSSSCSATASTASAHDARTRGAEPVAPHARREHRAQGARAGARGDGLPRPVPRRPRALRDVPAQRRDRRQHVLAAVPGDPRAPGARLLDPLRRPGLRRHRRCCTSTPRPTPRTSPRS